jgi:hypothetical protein
VDDLVALVTDDVWLTMPPIPRAMTHFDISVWPRFGLSATLPY